MIFALVGYYKVPVLTQFLKVWVSFMRGTPALVQLFFFYYGLARISSALDPELVGEVLNTIKQLAKENTIMILVTHEIRFARNVASRILFMDGGYIAVDGTSEEIIDHPTHPRLPQFLSFINKTNA